MKSQPVLLINHAEGELGQALALQASEHYRIALASQDPIAGNNLCALLQSHDHDAVFLLSKPGSARSTQHAVERVLRRWQQLDLAINLPPMLTVGPFEATLPNHWKTLLREQLNDTINLCHSSINAMLKHQGGTVLNVVPEAGLLPGPLTAAQSATSAAIIALGESLNAELDCSGIRVTTLAIPWYQQQPLLGTDPLSQARFNRLSQRSPFNAEQLAGHILAARNQSQAVRVIGAESLRKWRRKRWLAHHWEEYLRALGARYMRSRQR